MLQSRFWVTCRKNCRFGSFISARLKTDTLINDKNGNCSIVPVNGLGDGWTRVVNADGSVTATFDLNTLPFFAEGTELMGLTICTITANSTTGTVVHKSVEIQ